VGERVVRIGCARQVPLALGARVICKVDRLIGRRAHLEGRRAHSVDRVVGVGCDRIARVSRGLKVATGVVSVGGIARIRARQGVQVPKPS